MDVITASILSAIGGALVAGFVLGAKRIKGLTMAVRALSHDALFTRCGTYLDRGWITASELENLTVLWDAYSDQGLNGTGEELYNRAKALPLK